MGCEDIQSVIKSHRILCFLETMKDKNYHVNIPGFQTYHFAREYKHDKAKRASGGFLILISNCIHDGVRVQWESDNLVWVVIRGSH